jgi:hypothetical protein
MPNLNYTNVYYVVLAKVINYNYLAFSPIICEEVYSMNSASSPLENSQIN